MTKNKYLIVNFILIFLLILIAVYEKYPSKIHAKLKLEKNTEQSYSGNWRYKHELKLYKSYQKKGNVVMLGNSITYRANWNELLNREDIINRGIGADITEGFLARMEYVYNVNPKLCFVMGGVNDLTRGIKPEIISNNLYNITKELNKKNIKPILFSILYTAKSYPNYKDFNRSVKLSNDKIKKMCANNSIEYIDLNKILSENEILKDEYSFDGIHLTVLAYEKWKEIITPIIEREIE
ncbi:lipase/acylhydrolase family protein [unidentified eubacterium SCB49]|nr:lipase/acylhydrolase family protein [unidentified eubacterium SCB49]